MSPTSLKFNDLVPTTLNQGAGSLNQGTGSLKFNDPVPRIAEIQRSCPQLRGNSTILSPTSLKCNDLVPRIVGIQRSCPNEVQSGHRIVDSGCRIVEYDSTKSSKKLTDYSPTPATGRDFSVRATANLELRQEDQQRRWQHLGVFLAYRGVLSLSGSS